MTDYLYDGSFEGFLCCVYAHYYDEKASGIYVQDSYQQNILANFKIVERDEGKAATVYAAIGRKISRHALDRVYGVFLSSEKDKENILLRYIRVGFKVGPGVNSLHQHPDVFAAQKLERKVLAEVHRYSGILRFSVISTPERVPGTGEGQEILYAVLEPDHDVIELMADHFCDRYKWDPFIIHDKRREKALFAYGGEWYISPLSRGVDIHLSSLEKDYRQLWKSYFHAIAIKERTNPRCQKNFMPVRYWKNLTEMR